MTRAVEAEPFESVLPPPPGYLQRATLPLPSLVLLLPMIVLYEVGTLYLTSAAHAGKDQQIIAFSKMQEFFRLFGATGRHMPAMAVVGILLAWHIARNDVWKVEFRTLMGMAFESLCLSLPLIVLAYVVNRSFPLVGVGSAHSPSLLAGQAASVQDRLIMDLGAGVYEEFVFRFVLFTLFSLLLKDLLNLHDFWVYLLTLAGSGILFSAYHYWSPTEHFILKVFAFRALAGGYFGAIFVLRGFGITAASHSAYDLIITLL